MKSSAPAIILVTLLLFSCTQKPANTKAETPDSQLKFKNGMVVCAYPDAAQAGLNILKKGGNAIDAAVAVQFALAVTFPEAGNIGGGGFMVYRGANGEAATLDFLGKKHLALPQQTCFWMLREM